MIAGSCDGGQERQDVDCLEVTHSRSELLLVQTHGAEWMGRIESRGSGPGVEGGHL